MSQIAEIRSAVCGSEFIREAVAGATEMRWMYRPIANEFAPTVVLNIAACRSELARDAMAWAMNVCRMYRPLASKLTPTEVGGVAAIWALREKFAGDRT